MASKNAKYPELTSPLEIDNPAMPFGCRVPGHLTTGSMIIIEGRVLLEDTMQAKAEELFYRVKGDTEALARERFSINLISGRIMDSLDEHDIVFHYNPRFDHGCIVRNTLKEGSWGDQEHEPVKMPFARGESFRVALMAEEELYKVTVNGGFMIEYKHRLPCRSANILNIEGCIELSKVKFQNLEPLTQAAPRRRTASSSSSSSSSSNSSGEWPPSPKEIIAPIENPEIPFKKEVPEGLQPGRMIFITAQCPDSPDHFSINFERPKDGDIAFHFSVRFDQKAVVRNTFTEGAWQREDRWIPCFPFVAGEPFELIIRVETERYLVAVSGQHFAEFKHRLLPLTSIDTIVIEGDISVSSIKVLESDF